MSTASVPGDSAPPSLPRGTVRHRRTVLVAALGVGLLAGCAGTDTEPGTEGPGTGGSEGTGTEGTGTQGPGTGGSSLTEDLPAPYGDALIFSSSAESLCHVPTNQVEDIYVNGPDPTDLWHDHGGVRASGPAHAASAHAATAQAPTAHAATAPAPRTLILPDEGVVEEVSVEVVSAPDDPILELEITLTGPEQEQPYLTDAVSVSFLTPDDDRRWVGFSAHDGELTRTIQLDEPIAPSPGGTSTRVQVVPVACPTDVEEDAEFTAQPLADGTYTMTVFGSAQLAEGPEDDERTGHAMWGQEQTTVTVTDAVVEGIGYSGENAYSD
ncbi:hypothetical protein [Georgenia sp. Z1491]|uniref:hypothetical protein n=1 Tax=Georgenia sp. Z1491 TaxID=3416707 RepID=UPI003CEC0EF7